MTVVRVTTQRLIKAIRTERRLTSQTEGPSRWRRTGNSSQLYVCASGAALKAIVKVPGDKDDSDVDEALNEASWAAYFQADDLAPEDPEQVKNRCRMESRALDLLEAGKVMNSISYIYESWVLRLMQKSKKRDYNDRLICRTAATMTVVFMNEYFPKTVEIDIGGAEPARGIRVVDQ
jgi:hypothetical protein